MILCAPDLVLLVRSGPVNRDLGGSAHIWGDNAPVLISYFYDGAAPVEVFQNRSQSGFYMDNFSSFSVPSPRPSSEGEHAEHARDALYVAMRLQ